MSLNEIRLCKLLRYKKGEIIFEQGEPAFGLYYLYSGVVKLQRRTQHGYRQLLSVLQDQGYLLGIEALLGDCYDCTAQAMKDSQLLFIARDEFSRFPEREFLLAIARLAVSLQRRLASTLGLGAQTRIAYLLLEQRNLTLKRQELAALAGLTLEHTCRILGKFERRGLIQRDDYTIKVLNPQALESLL